MKNSQKPIGMLNLIAAQRKKLFSLLEEKKGLKEDLRSSYNREKATFEMFEKTSDYSKDTFTSYMQATHKNIDLLEHIENLKWELKEKTQRETLLQNRIEMLELQLANQNQTA